MPSLSPTLKSWLSTACYTLGLALAVYLAALKLLTLPCVGPGNCQAILYSTYGSVAGVPVGVFGAFLWVGAILVGHGSKRGALLFLLAAGTAVFMVIQFGVLRGFCLYCTLHAVAAWGAFLLHHERPRVWIVPLALLLAGGGFLATRQYVAVKAAPEARLAPQLATLADNPAALSWLGAVHPRSPTLVISLDCAACLDLLDDLTRRDFGGRAFGPAVYLKTTDTNHTLTLVLSAAVLSQQDLKRRDAFLAIVGTLLSDKAAVLADPEAAAVRLAALFPDAASHQDDAKLILAAQAKALEASGAGHATPLLIRRDGSTRLFFSLDELFP